MKRSVYCQSDVCHTISCLPNIRYCVHLAQSSSPDSGIPPVGRLTCVCVRAKSSSHCDGVRLLCHNFDSYTPHHFNDCRRLKTRTHTHTPPVWRDVMIMQFVGNFPTLNLRSRKVNVHTTYGTTRGLCVEGVCVCPRETWVLLGTTQHTGSEYLTCVVWCTVLLFIIATITASFCLTSSLVRPRRPS